LGDSKETPKENARIMAWTLLSKTARVELVSQDVGIKIPGKAARKGGEDPVLKKVGIQPSTK